MYLKLTGILVLMLFVSCKWWYKAEAEVEIKVKVVKEDSVVVAEKAAEEVSKATGKGVEEVKTLSKEELDEIAKKVADDAKKTVEDARGNRGNEKKTSELIKEIKESAEKFELAFKTLVGAGYTGDVVNPVVGNLQDALKRVSLVDKLSGIVDSSGSREDAKKAVSAFNGDAGSCMNSITESRGGGRAQKEGTKECMKSLMGNVSSSFHGGVFNELRDALDSAPEKFKGALGMLRSAAWDISSASSLVENKLSS
ncbi:hypothetical protein [Borrelia sp. RT5S]|uniref:hypothetical protein n=1 Tax=Borrelia sp. RT5S TaxID=2898581 RepID=UPI001E5B158F|nr:hypothetical protein [Borrelia sp. RT5S]UGQ16761.1 hypothetical protein LSO06_05420 [Borrelia sp. RT5S]